MEIEEGSAVLCTVKKIEGTTVFLNIEDDGEGSMMLSEVAAGRIRNLREYVFPNKKIVCKILKISNGHIELSLRRVTGREKQEVLEKYKKEKKLSALLKNIISNPSEIIKGIKKEHDFLTFFENAREDPKILEKYFTKEQKERLIKLLVEKIEREKEVKEVFKLSSLSPSGIIEIKEVLKIPEAELHYLGSSQFSITAKASDFKEANKKIQIFLEHIKQKAKQKHLIFEHKEK